MPWAPVREPCGKESTTSVGEKGEKDHHGLTLIFWVCYTIGRLDEPIAKGHTLPFESRSMIQKELLCYIEGCAASCYVMKISFLADTQRKKEPAAYELGSFSLGLLGCPWYVRVSLPILVPA